MCGLGMEEVLRQATMVNNGTLVEKMTASWSVGLGDEERVAFASRWVNKWSPSKGLAIVHGAGFAIKHKHGACDVCMTTPSDAT